MSTPPVSIDLKRLAAEVSAQHGIRIDPDDPMMAVVTLNRLFLEQAVEQILERVHVAIRDFETAAEKVQVRAGGVLAQEIRHCAATLSDEVTKAVGRSQLNSADRLSRGDGGPALTLTSWQWFVAGLVVGLALVGLGIWVGGHLSRTP